MSTDLHNGEPVAAVASSDPAVASDGDRDREGDACPGPNETAGRREDVEAVAIEEEEGKKPELTHNEEEPNRGEDPPVAGDEDTDGGPPSEEDHQPVILPGVESQEDEEQEDQDTEPGAAAEEADQTERSPQATTDATTDEEASAAEDVVGEEENKTEEHEEHTASTASSNGKPDGDSKENAPKDDAVDEAPLTSGTPPRQAVRQLQSCANAAVNSALIAQRLALMGQLSAGIAQIVVEEKDERKIIATAREAVISSFVPLDRPRMARNKIETDEWDRRLDLSAEEFKEHMALFKQWVVFRDKMFYELTTTFRKEAAMLDRRATFGVLQILAAWEYLREEVSQTEQRARTGTLKIANGRRLVEEWETNNRTVLQDQFQVKMKGVRRRFHHIAEELRPIQEAYEHLLREIAEAKEREKQATLAQRAAAELEERRRQERWNVEQEEATARQTFEMTQHTAFDDIVSLERFTRMVKRTVAK